MKTVTYTLPASWASALVNVDFSLLTFAEQERIENWLRGCGMRANQCIACSDDPFFVHYNEGDGVGGDVLEYTFALED